MGTNIEHLVKSLRELSEFKHDDHSVAEEAAEVIETQNDFRIKAILLICTLIKANLLIKEALEMKLKKGVNIKELNESLKELLPALDDIYKKYGAELWITSGNDGIHWGSTRKPENWRELTEEEVRKISNSKHYQNDAIDVRRRNIPKLKFDEWLMDVYQLFPPNLYDVVVESNHVHIEYDPKIITHESEIEPRVSDKFTIDIPHQPEKPQPLPQVKVKWYRRNGVKRLTGAALLIAGGLLSLNSATAAIGRGLIILGGSVGAIGVGHAVVKAKKKPQRTWVDVVLEILQMVLKQLKKGK